MEVSVSRPVTVSFESAGSSLKSVLPAVVVLQVLVLLPVALACVYRIALPHHEHRVGAAQVPHHHPDDPAHPHAHAH